MDRPLRRCKHPGCPELVRAVTDTACPTHDPTPARNRSYDRAWTELSKILRAAFPICTRCWSRPSTTVHHRNPLAVGGARLDPTKLEVLCRSCHTSITLDQRDNTNWQLRRNDHDNHRRREAR